MPPWKSSSLLRSWKPCCRSGRPTSSTVTPEKGVPSPHRASMQQSLPSRHSSIWPTVMREGRPWGDTMRSGTTPSTVKGMSASGRIMPMTPFWPWCEESLSPISGTRTASRQTRASRAPSLLEER